MLTSHQLCLFNNTNDINDFGLNLICDSCYTSLSHPNDVYLIPSNENNYFTFCASCFYIYIYRYPLIKYLQKRELGILR